MAKRALLVRAMAATCLLAGGCKSKPTAEPPPPAASKLEALPYVSFVPDEAPGKSKVTLKVPDLVQPGLNLYAGVVPGAGAVLVDLDGEVAHRWPMPPGLQWWHHVEMDAAGNLYGVGERDEVLVKQRWDGTEVWRLPGRFHHDLALAPEGHLFAIERVERTLPHRDGTVRILDDRLVKVSARGERVSQVSIYDLLGSLLKPQWLDRLRGMAPQDILPAGRADVFHTNTVQILPRAIPGVAPAGALLFCVRNLDTVAIVDLAAPGGPRVLWGWGAGVLGMPHQPTLLENGNILVFDNVGLTRTGEKRSRVLEITPSTKTIAWSYAGSAAAPFFTKERGGAQRLSNGDTLITESEKGRVFEITREGRVVWEYYDPTTRGNTRAAIYRMTRIEPAVVSGLPLKTKPGPAAAP